MNKKYIVLVIVFLVLLSGCGYDNYDPPKSELAGKVILASTGETVGVRETGTPVGMELYQDGYQTHTPISVYVNQDGTFAAKLFDGTYKLVSNDNAGPWVNTRDTVVVKVNGNTTVNYPVEPYFMLRNESYKVNGNILTVNFNIDQIVGDSSKTIQSVTLYINNTKFVDSGYNKLSVGVTSPVVGANSVSVDINGLASYPVLYARIGIQITNVAQMLYTTGSVQIK